MLKTKRAAVLLVLALLVSLGLPANAQSETGKLVIDASQDLGAISPYVYGAGYGPPTLVPVDMYDYAANSGITYFHFPAGQWANDNILRPTTLDLHLPQAKMWGMKVGMAVRLPGNGGTVEEAQNLMRYVMSKEYDVPFWNIGIEPDWIDAYYGDDAEDPSSWHVDQYNKDWRTIAEGLLEVNPDITLTGPDISQFPPTENSSYARYAGLRDWVRSFLEANGDLVDIVSIHRYPFPLTRTSITTIDQMRHNTAEWGDLVDNLRATAREATGRDIPVAITEANSHWSNSCCGEATPDSFYNGVWWADVLGRLIEKDVTIVSYFDFVSTATTGYFGLLSREGPRPTYYVYQLYQRFGTERVYSDSADPDVSVYAALREDGTLTLMVVNLGPDEASKTLDLNGYSPAGEAEVWRYSTDHMGEQIEPEDVSGGITVPGQSVTLYIIPAA